MIFKIITEDLQKELKSNMPQIRILLKKNPAMAYTRITEIGKEVGKKFNIEFNILNKPLITHTQSRFFFTHTQKKIYSISNVSTFL